MKTSDCVAGDVRIITENGMGRAEDLYNMGLATVVTVADFVAETEDASITQESSSVYELERSPIVKVETEEGYTIRVNPDHMFYVDSDWVEADSLHEGDRLRLLDHQGLFGKHGTYEEGVIQGILAENDSSEFEEGEFSVSFENISQTSSSEVTQLYEWVSAISQHEDSQEIQMSEVNSSELETALKQSSINRDALQGEVPESIFTASKKLVRGFLQTIFELRGNVENPEDGLMYIELYGDEREYLQDIQQLLINLGVKSDLEELPESSDRLVIENESVVRFVENIGALDASSYKSKRLMSFFEEQEQALLEEEQPYTATVTSVASDGTEMVYGLTEPTTRSYIANGFVSRS